MLQHVGIECPGSGYKPISRCRSPEFISIAVLPARWAAVKRCRMASRKSSAVRGCIFSALHFYHSNSTNGLPQHPVYSFRVPPTMTAGVFGIVGNLCGCHGGVHAVKKAILYLTTPSLRLESLLLLERRRRFLPGFAKGKGNDSPQPDCARASNHIVEV